ncbi:hypothetical protein AA0Z99_01675 [Agrococcus sp. 1P02AA]|uniref:hypothetical protein n=1 Tax=Agrococcus sp. 1P02AA TaxID=3132259 RepID=UPI0039A6287B
MSEPESRPRASETVAVLDRYKIYSGQLSKALAEAFGIGLILCLLLLTVSWLIGRAPAPGVRVDTDPFSGNDSSIGPAFAAALAVSIGLQLLVRSPKDERHWNTRDQRAHLLLLGGIARMVAIGTATGGFTLIVPGFFHQLATSARTPIDLITPLGAAALVLLIVAIASDAAVASGAGSSSEEMLSGWNEIRKTQIGEALRRLGSARAASPSRRQRAWGYALTATATAAAVTACSLWNIGDWLTAAVSALLATVILAALIRTSVETLRRIADDQPIVLAIEGIVFALLFLVYLAVIAIVHFPLVQDTTGSRDLVLFLIMMVVACLAPAASWLVLVTPARWLPFDAPLIAAARARLLAELEKLGRKRTTAQPPWWNLSKAAILCSAFFPLGPILALLAHRICVTTSGARPDALLRWAIYTTILVPVAIVVLLLGVPLAALGFGWITL